MPVLAELKIEDHDLRERVEKAQSEVTLLVSSAFHDGAYFTHMGNELYLGSFPYELDHGFQKDYDHGRLVICYASDIKMPDQPSRYQPRIHIIPPDSARKLAYRRDPRNGRIDFSLLHGLTDDNKPDIDRIHSGSNGILFGLREYVIQNIHRKNDINPKNFNPVRMIGKTLFALSRAEGVGELNQAVEHLRSRNTVSL